MRTTRSENQSVEAWRRTSDHGLLPPAPVALSIIIVSYNTRDLTLAALASIFRYPPSVPFEVIVLDNASSDGSYEAICTMFPQVRAVAESRNIGFAAGNNQAATYATGRRILLLNPDTLVMENTFSALLRFADEEPDRRIWGGRTLRADRTLDPTCCWRRPTLWSLFCQTMGLTYLFPDSSLFNAEAYGGWSRDSVRDVDIVTGCFMLVDAALWRHLNAFDPTFFMYAEEADFCLRAARLGARPGITPEAELVHYGAASEVRHAESAIKTLRGKVTLMRKHWSQPAYHCGRVLLAIGSFMRMVGSIRLAGRSDNPQTAKAKWAEIWRRRSEWLQGYRTALHC